MEESAHGALRCQRVLLGPLVGHLKGTVVHRQLLFIPTGTPFVDWSRPLISRSADNVGWPVDRSMIGRPVHTTYVGEKEERTQTGDRGAGVASSVRVYAPRGKLHPRYIEQTWGGRREGKTQIGDKGAGVASTVRV